MLNTRETASLIDGLSKKMLYLCAFGAVTDKARQEVTLCIFVQIGIIKIIKNKKNIS